MLCDDLALAKSGLHAKIPACVTGLSRWVRVRGPLIGPGTGSAAAVSPTAAHARRITVVLHAKDRLTGMDVASPRNRRWVRKPAWLGLIAFAILPGCSTYFGSDVLGSIRESHPLQNLAKATGEKMQSIQATIHDSLPVYIGTTPASFLRHVRSNPDPNIRFMAYGKLGDPDLYDSPAAKTEAITTLVAKLQEGKEPLAIRAIIVRSLGELGDPRGRDVVARAVSDTEGVVRTEACRALGRVGRPEDATTLVRIMTVDPLEDCRIAAIEGIGDLKSRDPRVLHVLMEGMEHEDPAIRLGCYRSLKKITGKDLGNTPEGWRRELEPQTASSANSGASPAKEPAKGPTRR